MHPVCTVLYVFQWTKFAHKLFFVSQHILCMPTTVMHVLHTCLFVQVLSMTVTVHCCLIVCISPCMHSILRLILQSANFLTVTYCSLHCFSYSVIHNTIAAFQVNYSI